MPNLIRFNSLYASFNFTAVFGFHDAGGSYSVVQHSIRLPLIPSPNILTRVQTIRPAFIFLNRDYLLS
jgi:hypothetical protein